MDIEELAIHLSADCDEIRDGNVTIARETRQLEKETEEQLEEIDNQVKACIERMQGLADTELGDMKKDFHDRLDHFRQMVETDMRLLEIRDEEVKAQAAELKKAQEDLSAAARKMNRDLQQTARMLTDRVEVKITDLREKADAELDAELEKILVQRKAEYEGGQE